MWLIHTPSGESGWHIAQAYQTEPCERLVFVKVGNAWKSKLWNSTDTSMRAKNYEEERADDAEMKNVFHLRSPGRSAQAQALQPEPENVSWVRRVIGYFF